MHELYDPEKVNGDMDDHLYHHQGDQRKIPTYKRCSLVEDAPTTTGSWELRSKPTLRMNRDFFHDLNLGHDESRTNKFVEGQRTLMAEIDSKLVTLINTTD